jgi:thiol-disulfide isomerase/thioredoxin
MIPSPTAPDPAGRRHWLLGALGLAAVAGSVAWARWQREAMAVADWAQIDPRGPRFAGLQLRTLDDAPVTLAMDHDRLRVLNFWARWCGPCRRELPSLARLADRLRAEGLAVQAVALDEDAFALREYLRDLPLQGLATLRWPPPQLAGRDALASLPQTWVVGRRGDVLARIGGSRDWDDVAWIPRLLGLDRLDRQRGLT